MEEAVKKREGNNNNKGKRNVFETKTQTGPKNKKIKTSFEKKYEIKETLKSAETDVICPGCEESFLETPNDAWVQCNYCQEWWHEDCSLYEGVGAFKCDHCV